ncbi:methylenetetrahydrofolate dehydrogenase [Lactobacillus pasteurii DSM 23907 = CRBIP 24.76]|uniref:Bifunctional protein FolD n=1 Tax=Lactobacillus pasteurii DSM 23907 = CRBIP 24.76 TaxID=1423790 RepID=I7JYQ1_9LACO|nr:bifunctional methylenetetrahydrofolate dehydrogenase/methenyltetrahydrofolate cyclohydrolase [Lactobacillus pasteurii]KRK08393.1 methylenetetrahydrofolate dehydrogenase [Lactobacillus pasteurii DSM 23907 = CRBIP 24.76]TDG75571.1 hypothetical protein C5L33_000456 [Lactobacillus pasteurii]CCI85750.1 Bifunctional protein FolD [Lactobacillus pasteurii DSM 23907 = CRBIP 24.76]
MDKILDGKKVAELKSQRLKDFVKNLIDQKKQPHFCVINIGDNAASKVYIRAKTRMAEKIGILQENIQLPKTVSEDEVVALIKKLNADPEINGVMVQLPAPDHINVKRLMDTIDPEKDVDCLTPTNIGRLWEGDHFVEPATAAGIISLLEEYDIDLTGKKAVIIGRSNIVGKPLAALLLEKNASVSILHSKTDNLSDYTRQADLLVAAVGQPELVKADMVKPGAIVIDVGINRIDNHLVGDVAFDEVKEVANLITPVPGGVGPLTVESLMEQVVKLAKRQDERR